MIKNENVTECNTSTQDNDGVWGYDVMLPKPIIYTITATIKGPYFYRGMIRKSSVKEVNDIVVTITNAEPCSGNTNMEKFYRILLS